jgi:hypothetical protein
MVWYKLVRQRAGQGKNRIKSPAALHLPALNPHLTKSRLNDALGSKPRWSRKDRRMADRFNPIFYCTVTLTVFCGLLMGALAIWGPNPQPPPIASLFETLKYGFSMGLFSLFGLLGAKSFNPPTQR